ncbi:MAG: type II secretion system protein GspN [Polyangiales bacterium]
MNRERLLYLGGYTAFFLVFFFLFAYWTFPYQRLAGYLSDKVAESSSGYTLEIGSISPYWLTGVELEDVKVRKTAAEALATPPPSAGGKDKPIVDQAVRVRSATARLGLFSLLFGNKALSFDAELEAGDIEGTFDDDGDTKHVVAKLEKVDLGKLGLLEALIPLPLKGVLTGDFDLTLSAQPSKTSGTVKLGIAKLVAGDGKAKLKLGSMGGLTIDPVAVGDVTLLMDVKEGVGMVKKLSSTGPDLTLDGGGEVRFAQPLSRSRLGLALKLKLNESYRDKSPRTKVMFSLLDGASSPQVAAAKTPDGAFQVRLSGPLTSPRVLPGGAGATKGPAPGALPAGAPGDDDE